MKNLSKENSHILKSHSLAKNSFGEKLSDVKTAEEIKSKNLAWVHLNADHDETEKWLTKKCDYLDSIVIDALLAEETRPRIMKINDGVFLILRCVNLNENSDPEDMISIRMWIDPYRIITVQKRNTKSIDKIEEAIKLGNGPDNSGEFLCMLLSNIFKYMEPTLSSLDEIMDDIEEELIDRPTTDLRSQLLQTRKQAIILRRYILPQRDVLNSLRHMDLKWINDKQKRRLQENHDNNIRYVEDLDAVRERAQIVKDELSNILSDKINRNMYVLSVIAAIFLPLGFLTGLLGVNLSGIPGAESAKAFFVFSGLLFFLVVIQIFLFKKFKWF